MSEKLPPTHPMIEICTEDQKYPVTYAGSKFMTPDEAISLGLALMETGLYLKAKSKQPPAQAEPAPGRTD